MNWEVRMNNVPCEERRFPQLLKALVQRVESTYAFWMKHLVERLGSTATRKLWGEASAKYDIGFLDQILASGWSRVDESESEEGSSMASAVLGSCLGAGPEGMQPCEARALIDAMPPLSQVREMFPNLNVQRETTAYEALHLYIHGLALLTEALIDDFGKQGELIAYDIVRSGRESMGRRIGGTVTDFMCRLEKDLHAQGIYAAGLDVETVAASPTEHVSRVKHCEWARYFRERHPSVGYLVACSADESFGRGYNESLRMQRTSTIMEGGSECDFRWYSVVQLEGVTDDGGVT
jgi:hypothetical protein